MTQTSSNSNNQYQPYWYSMIDEQTSDYILPVEYFNLVFKKHSFDVVVYEDDVFDSGTHNNVHLSSASFKDKLADAIESNNSYVTDETFEAMLVKMIERAQERYNQLNEFDDDSMWFNNIKRNYSHSCELNDLGAAVGIICNNKDIFEHDCFTMYQVDLVMNLMSHMLNSSDVIEQFATIDPTKLVQMCKY